MDHSSFYKKYATQHLNHHIQELDREAQQAAHNIVRQGTRDVSPMRNKRVHSKNVFLKILAIAGVVSLLIIWWAFQPKREAFSPLSKPVQTDDEASVLYNKHWPHGSLMAENIEFLDTYIVGLPMRGAIPRWAVFEITRCEKSPSIGDKKYPKYTDTYRHKIDGYVKGNLIPPVLACGSPNPAELGYSCLNVPMSKKLHTRWRKLKDLSDGYAHMLVGPFLNEPLSADKGVAIPKKYFAILVEQDGKKKRALWLHNESGEIEETTIHDIQATTELSFFED